MVNPGAGDQMGALLAKARTDNDFRKRLLSDPAETLRAEGITLPPGLKVKAVENTADLLHIVLPAKQEALADEALDQVTAGTGQGKDKPCGNIHCPIDYNSTYCWATWLHSLFLCKYYTEWE